MEEYIGNWLSNLIDNLDEQKNFEVLEACGKNCSYASGMVEAIEKAQIKPAKDMETLFYVLKESPFKEHGLEQNDEYIALTYEFKKCVCPIMNAAKTTNPHACHCTLGFLKNCLTKLSEKDVTVEMTDSFILNNRPCRFEIRMK